MLAVSDTETAGNIVLWLLYKTYKICPNALTGKNQLTNVKSHQTAANTQLECKQGWQLSCRLQTIKIKWI